MKREENIQKLHRLMYTLFYPAVLGAMIVAIGAEFTNHTNEQSDLQLYFSVLLAFYFSSQHVQTASDYKLYSRYHFIADIVEVFLLFFLFGFLGLINIGAGPSWVCFFILLAVVFLLPVFPRYFYTPPTGVTVRCKEECIKSNLLIVASLISIIGLFNTESSSFVVLVFLSGLLLFYLFFLVFGFCQKFQTWLIKPIDDNSWCKCIKVFSWCKRN